MFYWILNAPLHLFILAFKKDTELSAIYWKLKRTLNSQRYTEGWKGQWTLNDILKVEKDTELSAIYWKLKRTLNSQRYIESWKGHWTLSDMSKVEKDNELSAIYWKLKRTLNSQQYIKSWILCILWNSHICKKYVMHEHIVWWVNRLLF